MFQLLVAGPHPWGLVIGHALDDGYLRIVPIEKLTNFRYETGPHGVQTPYASAVVVMTAASAP